MRKLVLAAFVAACAITVASQAFAAGARPPPQLPPPKYDRPYHGALRVVVRTWTEIARLCGRDAWACTWGDQGGVCTIYLPRIDGRYVNHAGYDGLFRHEVGHCNGWPGNHPNARYPR